MMDAKNFIKCIAISVASAEVREGENALERVQLLLDAVVAGVEKRDAEWQKRLDDLQRENSQMVTEDLVRERGAQDMLHERLAEAVELMREEVRGTLCIGVDAKDVGKKGGITNSDQVPDCGCWWCQVRNYIREYDKWVAGEGAAIIDNEPVHAWFGLTYAQYFAVSRTVLQSMPVEWQRRFIRCMHEMSDWIDWCPPGGNYYVKLRDSKGRFLQDPYADYERGRRQLPFKEPHR
jgi:hypothetical protein